MVQRRAPAARTEAQAVPDSRPDLRGPQSKSPLASQGAFAGRAVRAYLAGTVTGARAAPGSFMNWKKLELGSTTSTSPGFENEAR